MPLKFPPSSFFESSGNAANSFAEGVRDGVVNFACDLWENFPGFITNNKAPGTSFARGFMSSVCSGRGNLPVLPPIPFTGGQCSGILYNFTYKDNTFNVTNCLKVVDNFFTIQVEGPIGQPFFAPNGNTIQTSCNGLSNATVEEGGWKITTGTGEVFLSNFVYSDPTNIANPPLSFISDITVTRVDGLPDNCGDLPQAYPSPPPTGVDLTTNITVNVADGQDLTVNVVYNQLSQDFNFPMGFKVSGVNVTLDLSGLTIYGDQSYSGPNIGNDVLPPGNDGGGNGVDPPYTEEFPDFPYPVLPDFEIPKTVEETLETIICNDGVIETIQETINIIPGISPAIRILLDIAVGILTEICDDAGQQLIVGFPEYYGLKPGASRPAIVYLYKTWDGTNYGASTYSATVNEPSAAAVSEIETVNIPNKTIGPFIASVTLLTGTRIRASGDTKTSALANFNYLLSKVDPTIIQPNVQNDVVITEDVRLNITTVVCRQIEYYPNGSGSNKTASIRRVIDQ